MTNIYKPFTPSTILSVEEQPATAIVISCGGGVGGSKWAEYTTDEFDLNEKFIKVNTNLDRDVCINTNNIVRTSPVKIVRMTVRNDGNDYVGNTGDIEERLFTVPIDERINVVKGYGENPPEIQSGPLTKKDKISKIDKIEKEMRSLWGTKC